MKIFKLILFMVGTLAVLGSTIQQAEAVLTGAGTIGFSGTGNITQNGGENTLNFNTPLNVSFTIGDYVGAAGSQATVHSITWTGSGASATLVGGPINPLWLTELDSSHFSRFRLDSLTSVIFDSNSLTLVGEGITLIHSAAGFGTPPARITITRHWRGFFLHVS